MTFFFLFNYINHLGVTMKNLYRILAVTVLLGITSVNLMAQDLYFTEQLKDTTAWSTVVKPSTSPPWTEVSLTLSSGVWKLLGTYKTTGSYLCSALGNINDARFLKDASVSSYMITPTLLHGVGTVTVVEGNPKELKHGIDVSTDDGVTWTNAGTITSTTTKCLEASLAINSKTVNKVKIYNAGLNAGNLDINIIKITSAEPLTVKAEPFTKVSAFKLGSYPNPFNPSTKVTFEVPTSSNINLSVFNMLGEKVATLHEGLVPAGAYSTQFNASNLPSGMYIVRLQAEKTSISKKVMLLK
jgi:hypothetical protein